MNNDRTNDKNKGRKKKNKDNPSRGGQRGGQGDSKTSGGGNQEDTEDMTGMSEEWDSDQ